MLFRQLNLCHALQMNEQQLFELIKQGEGLALEFKESQKNINKNVYETVCAFLNRHGGNILLGVSDSGKIIGVEPDSVAQIRKDFMTAINNPQKLNPACYLSIDEYEIDSRLILCIFVPESSQVHRCNGRVFDRNEDSDLDITDHTRLVTDLYHRKQVSYSENKVYPYATLADIREDLIAKIRKIVTIRDNNHPWASLNDLELLKSAQLYQTSRETGKSGITLAGILLLGKEDAILSVLPHHGTDLILRKFNLDRYDDRDDVTANLIESYERIMKFIAKHLPDPFYLERDIRISLRDSIFREVASNILIHREYINPFPAKLIIERGLVRTENSNKPHGFGPINVNNFSPLPKNPVIARFFREIKLADKLGSGTRNIMNYGKLYGGLEPELIEGDIFRTRIGYPDMASYLAESRPESGPESRLATEILKALKNGPLGKNEIASIFKHQSISGGLKKQIKQLLNLGLIEMTLPEKQNSRLQKYRLTKKALLL